MSSLRECIADVLAVGILVWLCDVLLLASRGAGELNALYLTVALAAVCLVCLLAALSTRRERAALIVLAVLSVVLLWLVLFGPRIPPKVPMAVAIVAGLGAIALTAYLPLRYIIIAIPAMLLFHHVVITRRMPGWMTIAAAIVLTPILPRLHRWLRARPPLLATVACLSVVAAPIAAATLARRVESHTWNSDRRTAPRSAADMNVVLIVIDTLRVDRVGAFGYRARPVTPFLDAFARTATVFPRSYAASSWTIPSVASMFTGLTCGQHGVVDPHTPLPRNHPTLAETLRGAGYSTWGISANFLLDEEIGFTRGFDHYTVLWRVVRGNRNVVPSIWDDLNAVFSTYYRDWIAPLPGWNWKARAADVTARGIQALNEAPRDRPLFLYLQYVDPHAPCDPVSRERFAVAESDRPYDPNWSVQYDREILDLDGALRKLVTSIDRRLDPRKTVVIIVADHGEQLGEDGERGHGKNLSEATIRVPLIVRSPALPDGLHPDAPFSTARVFDLARFAAGIPSAQQPSGLVSSSLHFGDIAQRAVIHDDYKFVQRWRLNPPSLIDEAVFALPDERHNVLAQHHDVADRLRIAAAADPLVRNDDRQMSEEMRAKLRALGYLH